MQPFKQTNDAIAERARTHLEQVVRIDSSSDETSDAIPSTPGQVELSEELERFFTELGAEVERDAYANMIATLPARGASPDAPPIALMIHLDTARGTHAIDGLNLQPAWDGARVPYPANPGLEVTTANYPALERYLGHDVVYGPGDAPFGLDDKLGLTHMMTLAWLLATNPEVPHPRLLLIARPDEEIGRSEALIGLAELLSERGVTMGYTLDGLDPLEINIENFNAAQAAIRFPRRSEAPPAEGLEVRFEIKGVNTHGATAKAEGHRPATRLAAELLIELEREGISDEVQLTWFASDPERDCDAQLQAWVRDREALTDLEQALERVVGPHAPRGASWSAPLERCVLRSKPRAREVAAEEALRFIYRFLNSEPGFTLAAEDSEGYQGYSQPYRLVPDGDHLRLDVRLRDFARDQLAERQEHVRAQVGDDLEVTITQQYENMGPRLADRPELIQWPQEAAAALGLTAPIQPIRGGTGVDPFLDKGVALANLGTGYFAPESEKEFTTLQTMADHARWLGYLVQRIANP